MKESKTTQLGSVPAELAASAKLAEEKKLLTAAQVANFLNCSESYVWELARLHKIPCGRIGKLVRFDPAAIERWWQLRQRAG